MITTELGSNGDHQEKSNSSYRILNEAITLGGEYKDAGFPIQSAIEVLDKALEGAREGRVQIIFVLGLPLSGKSLIVEAGKMYVRDKMEGASVDDATFEQGLGKSLKRFGPLWQTYRKTGQDPNIQQKAAREIKRLYNVATTFIEEKTLDLLGTKRSNFIFVEAPGMLAEIAKPDTGAIDVFGLNPWNDGDTAILNIVNKNKGFKNLEYDCSAIVVFATPEMRAKFIQQRAESSTGATPTSVEMYEYFLGLDISAKYPHSEADQRRDILAMADAQQLKAIKTVKGFTINFLHVLERFGGHFGIPMNRFAVILNHREIQTQQSDNTDSQTQISDKDTYEKRISEDVEINDEDSTPKFF